jgi:hypothetical protein
VLLPLINEQSTILPVLEAKMNGLFIFTPQYKLLKNKKLKI